MYFRVDDEGYLSHIEQMDVRARREEGDAHEEGV